MRHCTLLLAVAAGAVALVACGDDPFAVRWEENPDTVRLFALSRPEPNLFSGFDFRPRQAVQIEAPTTGGNWDLAVDVLDGRFVWLPPGALGVTSQAGLATLENETFASAAGAPADSSRYVSDVPVPIRTDRIYVIRTRRHPGYFGTLCNYYGKIEALNLDLAYGSVSFQYDVSGACNSRDLIPPS